MNNRVKKIDMCRAIAMDMEKREHDREMTVEQMTRFMNRNLTLNTVKVMYKLLQK